jgi:hypothetical protein
VFTELFDVDPERVCRELGDLEIDGDLEKIGVFVLVTVNVITPDLLIVDECDDVLEYIPVGVEYKDGVGNGDLLSLTVVEALDENDGDGDELIESDAEFVSVYVFRADTVICGVDVSIPVEVTLCVRELHDVIVTVAVITRLRVDDADIHVVSVELDVPVNVFIDVKLTVLERLGVCVINAVPEILGDSLEV